MTTDSRRLLLRRGDKTAWSAVSTPPVDGEPLWDKTRKQLKVGDGTALPDALPVVGREDPYMINVKSDCGAVGDGVAFDDAAFEAAFAKWQAATLTSFMAYGDKRPKYWIYIPAGTYLLKNSGALMKDVGTPVYISGLRYKGEGPDVSHIVFQPTTANQYLMNNADRFYHILFEGLSFHGDGANAATATLFQSVGSGHAQNYVFWRCNVMGTFKYGLDLTGSNNNSEMTFYSCGIHAAHPSGSFLHAGTTSTSDQFLNINFVGGCNVEYSAGHFIDMAKGGNINIVGGSWIHSGDGSTAQTFLRLGVGVDGFHSAGVMRVFVAGVRVEHRHALSKIIECSWARGNVHFVNVDTETFAYGGGPATPASVVTAEYGGTNGWWPCIVYDNCSIMGKHRYHHGPGSTAPVSISYRNSQIVNHASTSTFLDYVNDGGGGAAPVPEFADCIFNTTTLYDNRGGGGGGTGNVLGSVNGVATALTLWTGTTAQYNAISVKDSATVYVVTA